MLDGNPGMWRLREIWADGNEGKAAIISVAAIAVISVIGLIFMIAM